VVVVNKVKDFLERVGWTAIQAAAATALATGFDDWADTGKICGIAALIAALKVVVAQNVGESQDGAAIPGGIRGRNE
jgi:hypothetical protein